MKNIDLGIGKHMDFGIGKILVSGSENIDMFTPQACSLKVSKLNGLVVNIKIYFEVVQKP